MIVDRYIFRQIGWATLFVALTLAAIILLTQSLRFLELVIDAGASGISFWILTFLALPRFLEVILPLALGIAVLFIYNRLAQDSEMAVMRTAGLSPMRLGRPVLMLAGLITLIMFYIVMWLGPVSLSLMQNMRQIIKAEYSTILFREGVFNELGDDITVYVRSRNEDGELIGLLIHDSRETLERPITIMAARGVIVETDEGQQVIVYDGVRQSFNPESAVLTRLDFTQYSLDLPEPEGVRVRWREPEERTIIQLLNPNMSNQRDVDNLDIFRTEVQRRLIVPFLPLSFGCIALCCLLIGPVNRRGQSKRIILATALIISVQAAVLGASNLATQNALGIYLLYALILLPIAASLFILSPYAERLRHRLLYQQKEGAA